jgi:hypothetical protein
MFLPLVKISVENTLGDFSSLLWMGGFFFGIVLIYSVTFSFLWQALLHHMQMI